MVLHPVVNLSIKLTELSSNHERDRNNLREIVINSFIKEKAGHGKGIDTSEYKYVVETLSSGDKVFLTRPAVLSKGFDFVIHVENFIFMNGKIDFNFFLQLLKMHKTAAPFIVYEIGRIYHPIQHIPFCIRLNSIGQGIYG